MTVAERVPLSSGNQLAAQEHTSFLKTRKADYSPQGETICQSGQSRCTVCTGRKQTQPRCCSCRPMGTAQSPGWSKELPGREKLPSASPATSAQDTTHRCVFTAQANSFPCTWTHLGCQVSGQKKGTQATWISCDGLCTVQSTFDHFYTDSEALRLKGAPYLKFKS